MVVAPPGDPVTVGINNQPKERERERESLHHPMHPPTLPFLPVGLEGPLTTPIKKIWSFCGKIEKIERDIHITYK